MAPGLRQRWVTTRASLSLALASGLMLAACAGGGGTGSSSVGGSSTESSPTATSASPEALATNAAMVAYEGYWTVSNQANSAPGKQDWHAELAKYAADPALTQRIQALANFASVPAHFVGEPKRSPQPTSVSLQQPPRVTITDCLDVSEWKLVSDKPGEVGKNLNDPNQPQRYKFTAEVVQYQDPSRWLVQKTEPHLDQTC